MNIITNPTLHGFDVRKLTILSMDKTNRMTNIDYGKNKLDGKAICNLNWQKDTISHTIEKHISNKQSDMIEDMEHMNFMTSI